MKGQQDSLEPTPKVQMAAKEHPTGTLAVYNTDKNHLSNRKWTTTTLPYHNGSKNQIRRKQSKLHWGDGEFHFYTEHWAKDLVEGFQKAVYITEDHDQIFFLPTEPTTRMECNPKCSIDFLSPKYIYIYLSHQLYR